MPDRPSMPSTGATHPAAEPDPAAAPPAAAPSPSAATGQGSRGRGTLLLADISGYTGFLQGVADAHIELIVESDAPPQAYGFVSGLLDRILNVLAPPFRLAKLEGDAVFVVGADADLGIRGEDLLGLIRSCHAEFSAGLAEANSAWTCECGSCSRIHELDLKFVVHHGEYVIQRIANSEELLGPDVNVAHRLLKNHAAEEIGQRPYALLTDAALAALEVPADHMVPMTETYDRVPPIPVHVLPLA